MAEDLQFREGHRYSPDSHPGETSGHALAAFGLKNAVRQLLRLTGRLINRPDYAHKYCFAWHLSRLFRQYEVDCVFDIGAHVGGYRDFLRYEVGYRGRIISFEPVAEHLEKLRQRAAKDAFWEVRDVALGEANELKDINVNRKGVFSSFLESDSTGVREFVGETTLKYKEQVRVQRLDAIFDAERARTGFLRPYLKSDTQGFDLAVLRGTGEKLREFAALQFEASVQRLYLGTPNHLEVQEEATAAGFELSGMYPVSYDRAMRLVEYDCLMVNGRLANK
jgi:FkbM family methyltransferase